MLIEILWSMAMSTLRTDRTSSWSATAATGRLSASMISIVTFALFGSSAPRQRRGRKGLIGVSASNGALIGMIGPCADKLYAVEPAGVATRTPSADQFGKPFLSVDHDAQVRRLRALAKQRDLVDGPMLVHSTLSVAGLHDQRVNDGDVRVCKSLGQPLLDELVHQEADRAAVHAVDRLAGVHELMQGLQHQAVAAERDDDVGLRGVGIAVALFKPAIGLTRFRRMAGDKGDMLKSLGGCS